MPLTDFGLNYLRDRAISLHLEGQHDQATHGDRGAQDEKYFGDYKLTHIRPEMGNGLHRIVATYGDKPVATMQWSSKQIEGLDVADDHQRKGVARAMWEWGQTMRPRPKHSSDRTNQGDAWAKAIGGKLPRRKQPPASLSSQDHGTGTDLSNRNRTDSDPGAPSASELRADPTDENALGIPDRSSHLYGTPEAPQATPEPKVFANDCHEPDSGRFCGDGDGGGGTPNWPGILDAVDIRPGSFAETMKTAYAKKSFEEVKTLSLDYWRKSFMNSSNMRAYIEGRPMAPAFEDGDPWPKFAALTLKEALRTAPPSPADTWRLEAGSPSEGQTLDWSIKAVASERREAEGYRSSLLSQEATMYRVPKGTKAVYYPDGREAIVQGRFTVTSIADGVAELAPADATTAAAPPTTSKFVNTCHAPKGAGGGRFCETATAGPAFPPQDKQRPLRGKTPSTYHQESEEWIAKLTPQEQRAAGDYTGSYLYGEFNKNAVAGIPDARVAALDSALQKAGKRDTPIRVYRRVGFPTPPGATDRQAGFDQFMATVKVGEEIPIGIPGSFISTSVTARYPVITGWATGTVMFEINARSGAAIGNVTQGGGTQRELELLIPRNTRFRVVAVQHDVQFGAPPKTRGFGDTMKRTVIQVEEVD